tara:strand:- start:2194 stop:2649 length:456 start_codon:yes stop_codon:yes gene_type:complete
MINIIEPKIIKLCNKICHFCFKKININKKFIKNNIGWCYCNNCFTKFNTNYNKFLKSKYVLTYEVFNKLTTELNLPNIINVMRFNSNIENNWTFVKNILKDSYFSHWFQGKWYFTLTDGFNTKCISLENLELYNPDLNKDKINKILYDFLK